MKKNPLLKNNFIRCGLTGWLLETLWTGFLSFRKREKKLICHTSIWMFPIYGMASLFSPISRFLHKQNKIIRGLAYTLLIFLTEFTSGILLKKHGSCPWDYSKKRYNLKGVIRLDYAPLWFFCGLLFEKITNSRKR